MARRSMRMGSTWDGRQLSGRSWNARRRRALFLLIAIVAAMPLSSCGTESSSEVPTYRSTTRAATVKETVSLSLPLPGALSSGELAAGALETLNARDRVKTSTALFSRGDVRVGYDAEVEDVLAIGDAHLRDRAVASGNVQAGGEIHKSSSVTIGGSELEGQPYETKTFEWSLTIPPQSAGAVALEPEEAIELPPGRYEELTVKRAAKAILRDGAYSFSEVRIESGGELLIDNSNGPTQLFVRDRLTFRGTVQSATVGRPQLLVGALSSEAVQIGTSFTGVLVAPEAEIRVQAARPDGHTAFFWGKNVTLEPDTIIHPYAFDWESIVGGDAYEELPDDGVQFELFDPTVQVLVSEAEDEDDSVLETSKTFDDNIEFSLPWSYPLTGGVIADGIVTMSLGVAGGPEVTCRYQGGSSTSQPVTERELNEGRTLHFLECSDGLGPDARRETDHIDLSMELPEDLPDELPGVTAAPPMIKDDTCSDVVEMLSPAETAQMRESFDWNTVQNVAELDDQGRPTLYYAWIYVRDEEELAALDELLMHRLNGPFFKEEYDELSGRCGVITNPGDGRGVFVPAFIPGVTYNRLIEALTTPEVEGDGIIFDAVILREVPNAVRTSQGSVALEPLMDSGFSYLSYQVDPLDQAGSLEQDMGTAKVLLDAVEWVAQGVRDIGQWFLGARAEFDKVVRGRRHMKIMLRGMTGDPAFAQGTPMVRGWGPYAGTPLAASGMEVRIAQWLLDSPIPSHSQGLTNITGRAEMDIVAGGALRGNGICVELSTRGAMVTDFLLPNTLCDLRQWDPATGSAAEVRQQQFRNSSTVELLLDETRISGLFQADDVYRWSRLVLGFEPKQARIMSGFWADTVAPTKRSGLKGHFAPCLNYPNTLTDAAALGAALLGGATQAGIYGAFYAAVVTSTVMNTDIVMPLNSRLPTNREVMSHEYGHYLFCSLLQNQNGNAVSYLIQDTIQKAAEEWMGNVRYINEAAADFFTGQVVGAADYKWIQNAVRGHYCSATPPNTPSGSGHACWEDNQRGVASGPRDRASIGRVATLLHDVFDGQGQPRFARTFGNGDVWTGSSSGALTLSSTGYLNTDVGLDAVALPVEALHTFAWEMALGVDPAGGGEEFTDEKLYGALNTTMIESGVNWCDRCRVLALHTPGVANDDPFTLIQTCGTDPFLSPIMGPSPAPLGEMNAFTCEPCPEGSGMGTNGQCTAPSCPADWAIDASGALIHRNIHALTPPDPADPCPSTFIARVENIASLSGGSFVTDIAATMEPEPDSQENCEQTFSFQAQREFGNARDTQLLTSVGEYQDCSPTDPICLQGCVPESLPSYEVSVDDAEALEFRTDAVDNREFIVMFEGVPVP